MVQIAGCLPPQLYQVIGRAWRRLGAGRARRRAGASAQDKTLDLWWWGEQELPGLQAFVDSSVAGYKEATVTPMLQDTAVVISQFQTAAAAGNAPDIQYLWNGIYHMESVWFGYLKPPRRSRERRRPHRLQPDAAQPFRRQHLSRRLVPAADDVDLQQASCSSRPGSIPNAPPTTWDELLAACEKLKTAGIEPLGGGIQDGYWSEWYISHALPQNLDSARRGGRALHRRQGFQRSEISRALGAARGAEDARLPERRHVLARTLSGHRSRRGRQARHRPVDRDRLPGRPEDGQRPDRRHGHAGLRQRQARRACRCSTCRASASRPMPRIRKPPPRSSNI